MNRYLLELREPDGHIAAELLYFYDDGAGPVAMDSSTVGPTKRR